MPIQKDLPKILSLLCCFFLGSTVALSLKEVGDDPLFEFRLPKKEPVRVFAPKSVSDESLEKPQSRKLVLDFFKEPNQVEREKQVFSSVKKLTGLLSLADSFHDDPNYSVNIQVVYKNQSEHSAMPADYNAVVHSGNKARELTLESSKPQLKSRSAPARLSPLDMAIVKPINVGEKPKSKFEFPKHFF